MGAVARAFSRRAGTGRRRRARATWRCILEEPGTRSRPRTAPATSDPLAALDVSVLQNELLAPILKITDVRTDKRIDFVGGARGTDALAGAVDSGKAAVAFSMFPVAPARPDGRVGRRGHHAAQEHLVRTEATGRPADSRHLAAAPSGQSLQQPPRADGGERRQAVGVGPRCKVRNDNRADAFITSRLGPAVMPLPVLEEIQRDLLALPGVGMSILEISHRSKPFEAILAQAEADMRRLANIPSNYRVLFLQGGASMQFAMVPMNLLSAGQVADYIDSGYFSDKAIKDAKRLGAVNVAASTKGENYSRIPQQSELKLTTGAAYVHMTSNNTIEGTESRALPEVGDVPLVSDTSSHMFSRPIDVGRHGLIYAGAQKNLGPAGLTIVIVREDLLQRSVEKKATLPTMMNYAVYAEERSLYNTPPTFAVYALGLVMKWLIAQGGLAAMAKINQRKAAKLYAEIDRTGFYRGNGAERAPLADERHVPAADRRARGAFVKECDGSRSRRPQGSSIGRRHARVDLQRVPGGRRRCARLVHARIRTDVHG